MTNEGGGSKFPTHESDTAARRTLLDEIIALRSEFGLVARDVQSLVQKIDILGEEAGRTNSFLTAHALRLDSIGPAAPLNGLAGKTILVVDDEAHLLRPIKESLTRRGALVLDASTVDVAIGFVRNARLDAALVDLRLPRTEDGIELARWIRRARPEIAVVVTSGLLDAPGLDALPVARIPKPFGLEDLERVLCEAMGHGVSSLHPAELPSTLPPPARTGFDEEPSTPAPDTADESPHAKHGGEPPCDP